MMWLSDDEFSEAHVALVVGDLDGIDAGGVDGVEINVGAAG